MGRQQNLTQKNVRLGLASKWSMILKLEVVVDRAPVARGNEGDPALLEQQEMLRCILVWLQA